MKRSKALSMIGLSVRAGKTASGETGTEKAIKSGRAFLVIVAEDASDNTKKKFINMCRYREIPYLLYESKENIGYMMGKGERSVLAVMDASFAGEIERLVREEKAEPGD